MYHDSPRALTSCIGLGGYDQNLPYRPTCAYWTRIFQVKDPGPVKIQ